ncbi:polyprenyl synthetase family protein (plasmid) [Coraliomargarita sp. W4R53]
MSATYEPIEAISQRVESFVTDQRSLTDEFGDEAQLLLDAVSRAVSGGKRLRGRFAIAGWRAVAEYAISSTSAVTVPRETIDAASALEIFHAAALVHDDLIDNSDTRRGQPAAHRALEAVHRDKQWVGDAGAFGRSSAILLGDLLLAFSDDLFEEGVRDAPTQRAAAARAQYATMRREVTIGQFLDIAEESAFRSAPEHTHADRALRVASLKSARYSVLQPLLIGAALADANAEQLSALSDFGHPLGMAFQLRDDVLGVFGDERTTGKPSGDDLREGKRTVLIAYTREGLAPHMARIVDDLVGDPRLDAEQIAALQRTIVDSGALDRVESLIAKYALAAERSLKGARLGNAAVSDLRELARAATVRTT